MVVVAWVEVVDPVETKVVGAEDVSDVSTAPGSEEPEQLASRSAPANVTDRTAFATESA